MIDFTLQNSLLIQSKMNLIHQRSSIKYVWNSNFMFFIITSCFSINGCFEMRLSPCLRYVGAPSEDGSVCARASSTRVQSTRGVFDKPLGFCDVHSWKNTWNMKNSDCDRVVYGSTSELTVEYYLESCHLVSIRLHGHILWR